MSKSQSRKLRKEDRRLFYASRQVRFLLAWRELAALADALRSVDATLSRELHDLLTEFFESVPTSPAARAEATRLSPSLSISIERRRAAHIDRLTKRAREFEGKDQGIVNDYRRGIEERRRPPGALLAAALRSLADATPHQPEEDVPIDAEQALEQERIDQIAGELLSDLDL